MRKLTGPTLVFTVLLAAVSALAEAALEPAYSSKKPLYAFVVVNEAGTKVLKLAFDESQGTGKGYDTIYADLNFNSDLTDDAAIEGTIEGQEGFVQGSFPPIEVPVPYNEKAEGIENPCQLEISYSGYEHGDQIDHRFILNVRIGLRDGTGKWQYSFTGQFYTAEKPEGVVATLLGGEPILFARLRPCESRENHVDIQVAVLAGMGPMACAKDGQSVTPQIQVRNEQGEVVHSQVASSDTSEDGPPGMSEASIPIRPGRHSLGLAVDTGPLGGALRATQALVSPAIPGKEPTYASERPLYAAVALDERANKILMLVFDESKGAGKGYDTIYADLNFNSDLTDDAAIEGTIEGQEGFVQGSFPPIEVPVPYNEKAEGIANPCQLEISYYQFGRGEETSRHFQLRASVKLKDEEEVDWTYSFSNELLPAEKPEGVIAAAFGGELRLMLSAIPDSEKPGHVAPATMVMAGMGPLSCTKAGEPAIAHVVVRNEQGVTIHSEHVDAEKLVPG